MKLQENEILDRLKSLKGWKYENGRIRKELRFKDFKEAINFLVKLQPVADSLDHHPDICVQYNKVIIEIFTHDVNGITEKDFELAREIDKLLP
ncbi:MAG: 4a-hydroxytetrahydrobiopterin dehydratase [Sulfolobaceae archaeon]